MNEHYPFTNPPLPYAYNALEPFIDTKTMMLHHNRHLQTYVDHLNRILENYPEYQSLSLEELLTNLYSLPDGLQTPVKNNAGGVFNHLFFFSNMGNPTRENLNLSVLNAIRETYGSMKAFQEAFQTAALSVFGSGYAWLVMDIFSRLKIITTANQDTPLPMQLYPILCLDVWEHAYYLKHYNQREAYIADWFQVIHWAKINQNYLNLG